jgi:hypothetical protein
MSARLPVKTLTFGFVLTAAVAAAAVALQTGGGGPVVPVWDRDACDHCHMHVGEPAFAAQFRTQDGRVHHYDDPGCLMLNAPRHEGQITEMWFRQVDADHWLSGDEVAFVERGPSPMGYNLGAVPEGTPGAISLDAARARVAARRTQGLGHGH